MAVNKDKARTQKETVLDDDDIEVWKDFSIIFSDNFSQQQNSSMYMFFEQFCSKWYLSILSNGVTFFCSY